MSYFLETQALYQILHVELIYNNYILKKQVRVSGVLKTSGFSTSVSLLQFNLTDFNEYYYKLGNVLAPEDKKTNDKYMLEEWFRWTGGVW